MHRLLLAGCATIAFAAAAPAHAANILYDGIKRWDAGNGVSVDIRGRLQYDVEIDSDQSFPGAIPALNGSEWRAARIGADWTFTPWLKATTEFDFIDNDFQPTDVYLAIAPNDLLTVQIGHFKEAFSLEELTSSRFTSFMERGSFTDSIDLARRFGASVKFGGDNWSWTTAAQLWEMDGLDFVDGVQTASSRVTFAPIYDEEGERFVHLGAAIRYRDNGDSSDPLLRYRQRPMSHLSAQTVATPRFAESDTSIGMEVAYGTGPFHHSGEYVMTKAEGPVADADFNGFYLAGGWFLTGEHRTYEPGAGKFDRTSPRNPLGRGGFGAVELVARYDEVDLSDGAIVGGDQSSVTLGLNWYPTARTRVTANYIDADVDNGPFGDGSSEIFQARFQIDW